jgi:serine/threonine protein kinase
MELVEGLTLSDILHADAANTASRSGKSSDLPSLIAAVRKHRSSIHKKNPDANSSDSHPDENSDEDPDHSPGDSPKTGHILPVDQAIGLMERVCEAVEFAHQHGVLHRDLKPGNILLRADGDPLVADFGLAKLSGETGSDKSASLSLSGNVLGTVENMAPEQAESSKNIDSRADVYALGTILYQMCTGRKHFAATGNFIADIQSLQTHEPLRPRSINHSLDPDLEVIILKCLRTVPDERYRSVSALLADLQRFRRGEPIAARPVTLLDLTRKIIRRNKAASIVAGISLLLILLLVTGSIWSLSTQLANAESARQEAEESRLLAEKKEQEAQKLTIEAQARAVKVQENFDKATAAQALLTQQSKETETERKRRQDYQVEVEQFRKTTAEDMAQLNAQVEMALKNRGKALTARLLQ